MKRVEIVAPSSPKSDCDKTGILQGFADMGVEAAFAPHAFDADRFLAGTDQNRASDVMNAFLNPDVDIVCALRGGYGSARLLELLDFEKIKKHAKPFFGFSDTTALQLGLWTKCGLISYTGFMAGFLVRDNAKVMKKAFVALLDKKPIVVKKLKKMAPGRAEGPLIGGNLSVMTSLIGTPFMPDLTGAVLLIEEVREEPYVVDRLLTQMKQAGCFDQLAGIVLAGFHQCVAKDAADGTIEDVLNDHFHDMKIPVVKNCSYTHGNNELILPIGAVARLDANKGTLTIDEY